MEVETPQVSGKMDDCDGSYVMVGFRDEFVIFTWWGGKFDGYTGKTE